MLVHIKFMEFKKDGKSTMKEYNTGFKGKIVAACNGLIVLERNPKTAGLILYNPVTREDEDIPLGTNSSSTLDSYGLGFFHVSRRYKLLHFFTKQLGDGLRKLGCEIMDIGSGSWREVDVPSTKFLRAVQNPIFALGALHWVQYTDDGCMVSMPLDDEKFKTMAIPDTAGGSYFYFKSIFAMGEFLGFSGRPQKGDNRQIGVWILRGLGGEYGWEKQYNIDFASLSRIYVKTIVCYGGGVDGYSFIFKCGDDGCLYTCDDDDQMMRKIEDIDGVADTSTWWILPHVNSLVTWRRC